MLEGVSITANELINRLDKPEFGIFIHAMGDLRFKYTTTFSLPKIARPAIVYAEIVVVIDPFFVGVCPWIKVYRYNPTEICQRRLQGVRNVAQKLCSWERSFNPTEICQTRFFRTYLRPCLFSSSVMLFPDETIWASSRENLSSWFATRVDSNKSAQLQRLARGLKF